jgi:hypothetical protein
MRTPERVPAHGRLRSVALPSPIRGARPPTEGRGSTSASAGGRAGEGEASEEARWAGRG